MNEWTGKQVDVRIDEMLNWQAAGWLIGYKTLIAHSTLDNMNHMPTSTIDNDILQQLTENICVSVYNFKFHCLSDANGIEVKNFKKKQKNIKINKQK